MKPAKGQIEVNLEELAALLERARQEPLDEEGYQKLQGVLEAFRYLTDLIGDKDTTISRLRALLAKSSTEKTREVLEQEREPDGGEQRRDAARAPDRVRARVEGGPGRGCLRPRGSRRRARRRAG